MTIFSKKFGLPKMPPRKASSMTNLSQLDASTRSNEFGLDYGVIRARLSGRNLIFKNGRWRVGMCLDFVGFILLTVGTLVCGYCSQYLAFYITFAMVLFLTTFFSQWA